VAAGTIAIISIVLLANGMVRICWVENGNNVCRNFTRNEYQNIKLTLIEKVEKNEPLTIQEYQLLMRIYDFEVKNKRGLSFYGIESSDDILKALNKAIK
jgi:phenolic acid decarboxylase